MYIHVYGSNLLILHISSHDPTSFQYYYCFCCYYFDYYYHCCPPCSTAFRAMGYYTAYEPPS